MERNNDIRLPRPMGMTQAISQYNTTKDPVLWDHIQKYFIQQWLLNNQYLCGRIFSILELSEFLHCSPELIRTQMRDQLLNTKIWDKNKQDELIGSLMGQQILWALEDRMAVEGQVRILQTSQNGKYTPFVTSEVNKAIDMKIKTTSNLSSILKSIQGGGSINIFNQQQQNNTEIGVTMQEVIRIVGEENAKLSESKEIQYIDATYNPEEFPEVVATKQIGIDTSKEGLKLGSGDIDRITDNYKELLDGFDEDHHSIRREISMNIDPSMDDPDMSIYPK